MKRTIVDTEGPYPDGAAPSSDAKRPKPAPDDAKKG
jgi:hypothetical protein